MVLGAGGHGGLSWLVSEGHVSDEGVKGCLFCSAVFLGVLYILSEGQEFSPLVLLHIAVELKVLFKGLVSIFELFICLQVVGTANVLLDA